MVSGLYAAILAFIQYALIMRVVKVRNSEKVSLGDGGHEALQRRIRAHGNFVETVPMALVLMVIAELSGAPLWSIHVLGLLMVGARVAHAIGINSGTGYGKFRFYGMVATVVVYILGALLCLWLAFPVLLA